MVHSVELVFDRDTDAAVRHIWDALAGMGIKSQASNKSPSNRPHATMIVAQRMDIGVNDALSAVLGLFPFGCTIGAPMIFGTRAVTLVRLLVPSPPLVSLHAQTYEICRPFMPDGALDHAAPGQWTPHVTLARRVAPERLPDALSRPALGRDLKGTVAGIRHWDGNNRIEYPIN